VLVLKEQEPLPPVVGRRPLPISGGTLLITRDDQTAVAADPDRDSVWRVELPTEALRKRVGLPLDSEPGRGVEDGDGKVHVALRGSGHVAKIDPQSGEIVSLRPLCPAPRGMASEGSSGPADSGAARRHRAPSASRSPEPAPPPGA
jgi:hypothetical protein